RLSALLRIQAIEWLQCLREPLVAHVGREGYEVEVVTGRIALEDQGALDAQDFLLRRHDDVRALTAHNSRFERLAANQLPHAGFNSIQAAENLHRTLHPSGFPAGDGF